MDNSYRIEKKVSDFVSANQLIEKGDTVVIGVSGGADSTCLLFLLLELSKRIGFTLKVIHVEHGIRGEASMDDATFVEKMCEDLGVPCKSVHIDAIAYAKSHSLTLEEAARVMRYRLFEEYRDEIKVSISYDGDGRCTAESSASKALMKDGDDGLVRNVKIAVAHHMNDQAETVVFQMLRGSGIKGMSGMSPKRDHIIRPLLCLSRAEIIEYLNEKRISYRTDESNNDNSYSRNYLRNELIPKMEGLQPQAVSHINEMATELREIEAYLCRQARPIYEAAVRRDEEGLYLSVPKLLQVDPVLVRTVIRMAVSECVPNRKDIGRSHFNAIMELLDKGSGKKVNLPKGVVVERQGDELVFLHESLYVCTHANIHARLSASDCTRESDDANQDALLCEEQKAAAYESIDISLSCEGSEAEEYDFAEGSVSVRIFEKPEGFVVSRSNYTKCFDYDMITDGLKIRTAEPGDYLVIDAAGHKKDIRDYFVNEKVPARLRDKVMLAVDGKRVMWVLGYRISEQFKVTDKTKTIIEISVTGGFPWEKK